MMAVDMWLLCNNHQTKSLIKRCDAAAAAACALPLVTRIGSLPSQSYPEFSWLLALHHHLLVLFGQRFRHTSPHHPLIPAAALQVNTSTHQTIEAFERQRNRKDDKFPFFIGEALSACRGVPAKEVRTFPYHRLHTWSVWSTKTSLVLRDEALDGTSVALVFSSLVPLTWKSLGPRSGLTTPGRPVPP